jgi:hypothetical protein
MNLSLEELEESKDLLLDFYNIVGKIPISKFTEEVEKIKILAIFNDTETFLTKLGVNLVW